MISKLTIFACLLVYSQSQAFHLDHRDENGGARDVELGESPYHVFIYLNGSSHSEDFASGSIVNEKWILTSGQYANYLKLNLPANYVVKAGKVNLAKYEDSEQTAAVESVHPHENYVFPEEGPKALSVFQYDIGLIKLKTPLKFNKYVSAVKLPRANGKPSGEVVLSGWGKGWGQVKTNVLQKVSLPIIQRDTCEDTFKKLFEDLSVEVDTTISETNFCTGRFVGKPGPCLVDVGSPLMSKNGNNDDEIVGVSTFPVHKCNPKYIASIYVQVSAFSNWIEKTISKY